MPINLEEIRDNYKKFNDNKIIYIAQNEAASLDKDVLLILLEEIKRRKLENLLKGIDPQIKGLTEQEVLDYKNIISKCSCPICGQEKPPLIGTLLREVRSFIVYTINTKRSIISCFECSEKKKKTALTTTLLFGWWGIPFGIFHTIKAVVATTKDDKQRQQQSDQILISFIINNAGGVAANIDKEEELLSLLRIKNEN